MIRNIQNRIILLIALIAICIIAGIFISRYLGRQRVESMLDKKKTEAAGFLTKVIDFKSRSLKNFAYDYTFWDEMVDFTKNPDTIWAVDNIKVSLPTFNLNYAWVINLDLSVLYDVKSQESNELEGFPLSVSELRQLVATGPYYDFFVKRSGTLIQISGGSIHASSDPQRLTSPNGYFFVGRIWTPSYIEEIKDFTQTDLAILDKPDKQLSTDSINIREFGYVNFMPIHSWEGSKIACLRSAGTMTLARDIERRSGFILIVMVISLLVALVVVSIILIRVINRPLRLLISSLVNVDPEPIKGLMKDDSEFGRIAQLINDFFKQKKELVDEIGERIKIEKELIIAKEKAEESERLKTAFLNNISHEIRTPMNAIMGFSELILDERISTTERLEFNRIISESCYRLLGVISDLISISAIETGQAVVMVEKVNLNAFLGEVFKVVEKELLSEQVRIILDVALRDEHSGILTDPAKLEQVILNLLRNAIKFTNSGEIKFGYAMRNAEIEFYVKDTGIGIAPEKFVNIFARFQKADDSLTREYGGTGLGLPISKAYVELLGGRIWLESEIGKGSGFFFTIPHKTI